MQGIVVPLFPQAASAEQDAPLPAPKPPVWVAVLVVVAIDVVGWGAIGYGVARAAGWV